MKLSEFLDEHVEQILVEWEAFARTLGPAADSMSGLALRDHARPILEAVAADISSPQSRREQHAKSEGLAPEAAQLSAASIHGTLRHESDFSVVQLGAEFRALRATVLRLWLPKIGSMSDGMVDEMVRFNEAIDQALAESLATFSARSDSTRDMFLAILGHDLRAPLASMSLAGELLAHPKVDLGQVPAVASRITRGATLMSRMVEDLIEYARMQLGSRMPIDPRQVDLGEACTRAVEDAGAAYPGGRFDVTVQEALGGRFDGVRLHQLLINLLMNAAQHGAKGQPVTIDARAEDGAVVVRVVNQGPPIPREAQGSIFKPLVQLPADDERDAPLRTSLGLGLYIAREIAVAHGGDISLESGGERGTIFTVRLPTGGPEQA